MELFIIRHAQSFNNALADQRDRVVDPALTDLGLRQAQILATHLARETDFEAGPSEAEPGNGGDLCGYCLTRLFCSPMLRALQTAGPIATALGLRPEVWVEIHEHGGMWRDHGDDIGVVGYPGMTRLEIQARFPALSLPPGITDRGWYDSVAGHESEELAVLRAAQVARDLRGWPESRDRIALVTHGGFSSFLLRALFSVPAAPVFFHHDNTGITRVRFRGNGQLSLRYLNRVTHLPPDMVS